MAFKLISTATMLDLKTRIILYVHTQVLGKIKLGFGTLDEKREGKSVHYIYNKCNNTLESKGEAKK